MKKALILLLCAAALLLAGAGAQASSVSGAWTSKMSSDYQWSYGYRYSEAIIYRYLGSDKSVIVPERIDGYTVVGVGSGYLNDTVTNLIVNAKVDAVDANWFSSAPYLTSVNLGSSVKTVEDGAFASNPALRTISMTGVTHIGDGAFKDRDQLVSAAVGSALESVGASAFEGCVRLKQFRLPQALASIGDKAFSGCGALTSLSIEGESLTIGANAFEACGALETVAFTGSQVSIGSHAFSDCTLLGGVTFAAAPASVGDYAFAGCAALTEVDLSDGPCVIGEFAFNGCAALSSLTLPQGLTALGAYAFYGCGNITSLTVPSSLVTASGNAWPRKLGHITLADGLQAIGDGWFGGCTELKAIDWPRSVTAIGRSAFSGCAFDALSLPEGIVTLGENAFTHCQALVSVTLPDSLTSIGALAFSDCDALRNVEFGQGLKSIGGWAFEGCDSLSHVDLPDSLERLGVDGSQTGYVFYQTGVTDLNIPEGVTHVGGGFDQEKIFLPRSLQAVTGSFKYPEELGTVIYCYEGSWADTYAQAHQIDLYYVDGAQFSDIGTVSVEPIALNIGQTQRIRCTVFPEMGADVIFTTTNRGVASVSEGGVVTGMSRGTAWIGVKVGNYTAHARVRVRQPVTDFAVEDVYAALGEDAQITCAFTPADADTAFVYSADASHVRIAADGSVTTSVKGEYPVTVTDTVSGLQRALTLYVCDPVTDVALNEEALSLTARRTAALAATVTTAGGTYQNQLVKFISSDPTVASVSAGGLITARRPGAATITAQANSGASAACQVTVLEPVELCLPAGLTEIEAYAFAGGAFTAVYVPDSCRIIGSRAFAANPALERVYLPGELEYIAGDAFVQSYNVTIVTETGSQTAQWAIRRGFPTETVDVR